MVAEARKLSVVVLERLVRRKTHVPQFGFLGASYVHVPQRYESLARLLS